MNLNFFIIFLPFDKFLISVGNAILIRFLFYNKCGLLSLFVRLSVEVWVCLCQCGCNSRWVRVGVGVELCVWMAKRIRG